MWRGTANIATGVLPLLLMLVPVAGAEDGYEHSSRAVVRRVQPAYPEIARRLSLEGLVMVTAEVAADGHVKSVGVVSGNAILAQSALRAVREWVFSPGTDEIVPVGVSFNRKQ